MTLRRLIRLLLCLCSFATGPALVHMAECRAQFSYSDEPTLRPADISPLGPLLTSVANVVYNYGNGVNQYWDTAARHYRGGVLRYFYYPQIPGAGYRSFSIVQMQRSHVNVEEDITAIQTTIERTEHEAGKDRHWGTLTYHYDSSGWLRAIKSEGMSPMYEGYTEQADSFFYTFHNDGSLQISWMQSYLSTGTGYAGSIDCPELKGFHKISKQIVQQISLDRFQNITSVRNRTDEVWDTCRAGGPKTWQRTMSYDEEGKLIQIKDSSSPYHIPTMTQTFSYELKPYTDITLVDGRSALKALGEPAIKIWLSGQAPLSAVIKRTRSEHLVRRDFKMNRDVLRPDSPDIRVDTAYYILDGSRRRIAYLPAGSRQPISFYVHGLASKTAGSALHVQSLPAPPEPTRAPAVVCDPLALSTSYTHKTTARTAGTDTLRIYYATEVQNSYPGTTRGGPQFSQTIPDNPGYRIETMSLTDNRGLVKYLWLKDYVYKLSYH